MGVAIFHLYCRCGEENQFLYLPKFIMKWFVKNFHVVQKHLGMFAGILFYVG